MMDVASVTPKIGLRFDVGGREHFWCLTCQTVISQAGARTRACSFLLVLECCYARCRGDFCWLTTLGVLRRRNVQQLCDAHHARSPHSPVHQPHSTRKQRP